MINIDFIKTKIEDKVNKSFIKRLEYRIHWFNSLSEDDKKLVYYLWRRYKKGYEVGRFGNKLRKNTKVKIEHFYNIVKEIIPGDEIKIRISKIDYITKYGS